MADTTIDLLKNSSYVEKMDELIAAVKLGGGTASDVEWDNVLDKPTTIAGYGITDAKIENGTITLGNQTITPLTSAPVTSVNSKTGVVVLTANDVGALPNTTTIPDKTSQLDNDSGYITNSALTDYAKKTEIPTKTSELTNDSGYITNTALEPYAKTVDVPTKTSQLTNDSNYITAAQAPVQSVNNKTGAITLSAADVSAIPSTLTGTAGQVLTKTADGQEWKDVEIPSGGGSSLSAFEKIGTIDLSTMASQNLGVEYTVTDVTEIVLVWTGMTNTTTTASSLFVKFNGGTNYNTLGPRTGKAGDPKSGYTYLKILEGVGILAIVGRGAINNTNYTTNGAELLYNLIPEKEKIHKLRISQPNTQYYADAGIVDVYVR